MQPMPKLKKSGEGRRPNPNNGGMGKLPPMPSLKEKGGPVNADPEWRVNGAGFIVGNCRGCGKETRAMGLVPTIDRVAFGKPIDGGWYCSECKPREFGRINGQPTLALRGL